MYFSRFALGRYDAISHQQVRDSLNHASNDGASSLGTRRHAVRRQYGALAQIQPNIESGNLQAAELQNPLAFGKVVVVLLASLTLVIVHTVLEILMRANGYDVLSFATNPILATASLALFLLFCRWLGLHIYNNSGDWRQILALPDIEPYAGLDHSIPARRFINVVPDIESYIGHDRPISATSFTSIIPQRRDNSVPVTNSANIITDIEAFDGQDLSTPSISDNSIADIEAFDLQDHSTPPISDNSIADIEAFDLQDHSIPLANRIDLEAEGKGN